MELGTINTHTQHGSYVQGDRGPRPTTHQWYSRFWASFVDAWQQMWTRPLAVPDPSFPSVRLLLHSVRPQTIQEDLDRTLDDIDAQLEEESLHPGTSISASLTRFVCVHQLGRWTDVAVRMYSIRTRADALRRRTEAAVCSPMREVQAILLGLPYEIALCLAEARALGARIH
ncbi:hypothetical protein H0H81_008623, partial [Sphagnurus paluster]